MRVGAQGLIAESGDFVRLPLKADETGPVTRVTLQDNRSLIFFRYRLKSPVDTLKHRLHFYLYST